MKERRRERKKRMDKRMLRRVRIVVIVRGEGFEVEGWDEFVVDLRCVVVVRIWPVNHIILP